MGDQHQSFDCSLFASNPTSASSIADGASNGEEKQEQLYGRGRRLRNSSTRVDYQLLAGEADAYDSSDDIIKPASSSQINNMFVNNSTTLKNNLAKLGASFHYANKHVPRFLHRSFINSSPPSSSSSLLQTITDGSKLTVSNIVNPNYPLSISKPMIITDTPQSIGMTIPYASTTSSSSLNSENTKEPITIRDIGIIIGMSHPVTVMDVRSQEELDGWVFGDLVDYFEDDHRIYCQKNGTSSLSQGNTHDNGNKPRVLNQISLEYSHTPLRNMTTSPSFVRELDWIDTIWPAEHKVKGDFPRVQYYCLTSTSGCYTDFHVDFGGTSVWYHVLSGQKEFLLVPPTEVNLELYELWLCSKHQADIFFPDMKSRDGKADVRNENGEEHPLKKVEQCVRAVLKKGQTLIIPTGWIHAVYTPVDSIVIGGNFLHGLDIKGQLDVHCLETRTRVPAKFRFPSFVRLMFYAGVDYLNRLFDSKIGDGAVRIHQEEVDGLQVLINALNTWAVQPGNDADRVGSVSYTTRECVNMLKRRGVNDIKDMLKMMEVELEDIKNEGVEKRNARNRKNIFSDTVISSNTTQPKLKLSLKLPQGQTSSKNSGNEDQKKEIGLKPKLKLKLGNTGTSGADASDACEDESKEILDNIPSIITSNIAAKSIPPPPKIDTGITRQKMQRKSVDISSYRGALQEDDEEWVPGGRGKGRNRRKSNAGGTISTPNLISNEIVHPKIQLSIESDVMLSDDENSKGSSLSAVSTLLSKPANEKNVPKKKVIQKKLTRPKMNIISRRPSGGGARDRLKKRLKF